MFINKNKSVNLIFSTLARKSKQSLLFPRSLENKKGFVVLYTVLIASIILAIVIGISSISYGEIILSAEAREGNIAFFAADTGSECALYWDRTQNVFSAPPATFSCDGLQPAYNPLIGGYVADLDNQTHCAVITVDKNFINNNISYTRIESRGYNVSCSDAINNTNPKTIERAIRVTYVNGGQVTPPPPGPLPLPPAE